MDSALIRERREEVDLGEIELIERGSLMVGMMYDVQ